MDFTFNNEQRLLDETLTRLVRDRWGFDLRARGALEPKGFSTDTWALMADLGLLSVPFSQVDGGIDGGGTELMIVHRALGRALAPEPYLATVVLAGGLIARLGNDDQRSAILPEIMAGRRLLALACLEPAGRYHPLWIETRAVRDGAAYRLTGRKAVVVNGDSADQLIVTARTSGKTNDRDGIAAFLVDPNQEGVTVRGYATIDGRRAAEVHLEGVRVEANTGIGTEGRGADALEWVFAAGCAALCAEAVGAMEIACDLTLEYLKTRRQFGVPISHFQVLQHRLVDMRIALEKSTSMAILAACSLQSSITEREQRISAAKCLIGKAGRFVAEQAIQMHGGMGMTEESAISHYAKRLVMIDHWLGDSDYHLGRFVAFADAQAHADLVPTAQTGARSGTAA
jgi:alkylation response protein AidB-like acyl-CoA dehydrogenase